MIDLLHLNDDCLGHIFTQLDLQSCEQVRQVCRRFEHIIREYCQCKYKLWSIRNSTDLTWLVENMNTTVEALKLNYINPKQHALLAHCKFPHCKSLAIKGSTKECTKSIVKSCPNLECLVLVGGVDLNALLELSALEELTICFKEYDETQHFSEIFRVLKLTKLHVEYKTQRIFPREDFQTIVECTTLKDIALHGELMNIALCRLKQFPRLEKIAYIRGVSYSVFDSLIYDFADRITTLYSNGLFRSMPLESFRNVPNLRALIVNDNAMRCYVPEHINYDLPALRELHFLNEKCCFIVKNEDVSLYDEYDDIIYNYEFKFLTILKLCFNLVLLVLPFEWLHEKFILSELLEMLHEQSSRRRNKLELRLWVSSLEDISKCKAEIDQLVKDSATMDGGIWLGSVGVSVQNLDMDEFSWYGIKNYGFQIELENVESNHVADFRCT